MGKETRECGRTLALCRPCAEALGREWSLRRLSGGRDNKVTCDRCGRRRYGVTYELSRKKEERDHDARVPELP